MARTQPTPEQVSAFFDEVHRAVGRTMTAAISGGDDAEMEAAVSEAVLQISAMYAAFRALYGVMPNDARRQLMLVRGV